jgi:hypothetical protein
MASVIDSWDSGLPGANWDSGLQWDLTVGPNPGDISGYLKLFTSEHNDKPNFMATAAVLLQPIADIQALIAGMPALFDVDNAAGDQLDKVGEWVGVKRDISVPLAGVYFSLDTPGVGFDQGTWFGPFDPLSGLVHLPDDGYRTLLRARIASNHWDGTIPGAYAAWDTLFRGTGFGILIQDAGNMHMAYALTGPVPNAVTKALFTGGYLNLKPATVKIDLFMTPTVANAPYFGFDVQNGAIAGFDTGAWGSGVPG